MKALSFNGKSMSHRSLSLWEIHERAAVWVCLLSMKVPVTDSRPGPGVSTMNKMIMIINKEQSTITSQTICYTNQASHVWRYVRTQLWQVVVRPDNIYQHGRNSDAAREGRTMEGRAEPDSPPSGRQSCRVKGWDGHYCSYQFLPPFCSLIQLFINSLIDSWSIFRGPESISFFIYLSFLESKCSSKKNPITL